MNSYNPKNSTSIPTVENTATMMAVRVSYDYKPPNVAILNNVPYLNIYLFKLFLY